MILIAVLVVVSLGPWLWWKSVLNRYRSLNGVPGPKPLPMVGNTLDLGTTPQDVLRNCTDLFWKYGRVYKVFVGEELRLFISDAGLTKEVLSSNVLITKSNAYDLMREWLGDGLLLSKGQKWKTRRRMITPTFHFNILQEFMEVFNSATDIFVENLSKRTGPLDIYNMVKNLSLDVICETAMGVKISAQQGKNTEYVSAMENFLNILVTRVFSPWKRFDTLYRLSLEYKSYAKYLKILQNHTNNIIAQRREERKIQSSCSDGVVSKKRRCALLDLLLQYEDFNELNLDDIREEVDTFMFEGHDTTSAGISFSILALAENQEVQRKVFEEIQNVLGEDHQGIITMQQIAAMKYLDMFIKEAQRVYPSVPFFERRIEADCKIGNYNVPKGTLLTFFVYALHRDGNYFANPEKFDPDRFHADSEQIENFSYLPFSAGPRNCIGQKFAVLELKIVMIKLLQRFKIFPVPNFKPDLGVAAILKSYNGLWVELQKRSKED